MMLRKRPRYPVKRTSSMTEIVFDLNPETPSNPDQSPLALIRNQGLDHRMLAPSMSLSQRNFRRNSADFSLETPHFLRSCLLCKRPLVPGQDIYMYRGDSAYCSAECREKQMMRDERKDKCSISATKKESSASSSAV